MAVLRKASRRRLMPTYNLSVTVTDNQATKVQRWFDRWNPQQSVPFADLSEYLIHLVKLHLADHAKDENLLRIGEVENALRAATDEEQDQILAILEQYMIGV
jgi:hypothetical protein